jgi:hypothetical protein
MVDHLHNELGHVRVVALILLTIHFITCKHSKTIESFTIDFFGQLFWWLMQFPMQF